MAEQFRIVFMSEFSLESSRRAIAALFKLGYGVSSVTALLLLPSSSNPNCHALPLCLSPTAHQTSAF